MKSEGRMLIIDQLNLFFRNYIVNPSLSSQGQPIGGLRGCIQSLQKLVRETNPDMIVVCWDGAGGSKVTTERLQSWAKADSLKSLC